MTPLLLLLVLLDTVCGATGGFFFKKATNVEPIWKIITKPQLYVGGVLYVLSALLNIYILRFLPYSVAMPMMSATYIWTMLIAKFFLGEQITARKIAGVALIVLGAVLLGLSL